MRSAENIKVKSNGKISRKNSDTIKGFCEIEKNDSDLHPILHLKVKNIWNVVVRYKKSG